MYEVLSTWVGSGEGKDKSSGPCSSEVVNTTWGSCGTRDAQSAEGGKRNECCLWEGLGETWYFQGKEAIELGLEEQVAGFTGLQDEEILGERKHGLSSLTQYGELKGRLNPEKGGVSFEQVKKFLS